MSHSKHQNKQEFVIWSHSFKEINMSKRTDFLLKFASEKVQNVENVLLPVNSISASCLLVAQQLHSLFQFPNLNWKKKTITINHIIKFMTKTVEFTHTSCIDYIKDVNSTVSPVRYLSYSERYMTYQQLFHNLKADHLFNN